MMNIQDVYEYCMAKAGVTSDFPFDEKTLVVRVGNKMFALIATEAEQLRINLKCDPVRAIELREHHSAVIAGYHMSKKHWNTIDLSLGNLDRSTLLSLIDHSYDLVFKKLPAALRAEISRDENS